jgi:thiamine-monophosphate kinase
VRVSDSREFGLIKRLTKALGAEAPEALIVGIGDDAAVWKTEHATLIATTDTMVEGVHFLPEVAPYEDVGWKALAVSVSDIAAMGGWPLFALVTLALPGGTPVAAIDALYAGLRECAHAYGVTVAGGDVVRAPQIVVTVALVGRAEERGGEPLLLKRSGARAGDAIAVTGTLGDSAGGLRRLRDGAPADDPLVHRHLRPQPPLALAREAARAGLRCAIDISDGLLQDVGHICRMSRLGARIRADAIPISEELRRTYPDDALALACTGGEDYEILLVGDRQRITALAPQLTVIGEMVPGDRPAVVDAGGHELEFDRPGYDHLSE